MNRDNVHEDDDLDDADDNESSASNEPLANNSPVPKEPTTSYVKNATRFKQFEGVDDFSDHHYCNSGFHEQEPSSKWIEKLVEEREIMETALPDSIYVKVYNSRMDLLRAVIVGPQRTPFHDNLFVFDAFFPPNYPDEPPMVHSYSGLLNLQPGVSERRVTICLTLLETWFGALSDIEWLPHSSTMLQVLLKIQELILKADSYFNDAIERAEPNHLPESFQYAEQAFLHSLKSMLHIIETPPKNFEVVVADHFRSHAHDILSACNEYVDGTLVGSLVNGKVKDGIVAKKGGSSSFCQGVKGMLEDLIAAFTRCGAIDCEKFRVGP